MIAINKYYNVPNNNSSFSLHRYDTCKESNRSTVWRDKLIHSVRRSQAKFKQQKNMINYVRNGYISFGRNQHRYVSSKRNS